ncbi:AAA family ATPase [Shewanella aestuarii]|uniref:AAA family ATPase n=1 Tax=Shewanella aestuarii TaxID=1028752 RepID=A0A6G9QGY4_9GAMM|nr:AAA family ATPase [Shewanella aestuarii]QIR13327.1 AAA family ATPase [Shewanella aestuarii]
MSSELLLLPSQDALIQRLQHIASYSEQLLLLCGVKGSGKSTLSIALASELDEYNSALVLCPQHAEPCEIRRKILVQLISSPIFDDDVPLIETFVRIQSTLTKPLHIIIDDAHLLPKTLWAECILLSQMMCAGAKVSVTMAMDSSYYPTLVAELSESMRDNLLPITIEALPVSERNGLYQSLLLRTGQTPFTPRDIIYRQLEKQTGTPAEVVDLLALALEKPEVEVNKWSWQVKTMLISVGILLVIGSIYWFNRGQLESFFSQPQVEKQLTVLQLQHKQQANRFLVEHGRKLVFAVVNKNSQDTNFGASETAKQLKPLLEQVETHASQYPLNSGILITKIDSHDEVTITSTKISKNDTQSATTFAPIKTQKVSANIENTLLSDKINIAEIHQAVQPAAFKEADLTAPSKIPPGKPQGFTLQIASVNNQKSLDVIIAKLSREQNLYLAKHQSRFVLLLGQFNSTEQAQAVAKRIQQLGLSAPWVRKWQDLDEYIIEREIR